MYSRKCGHCGANLDPGEHCDCIGQKIADGIVVVGVDLAGGKDNKKRKLTDGNNLKAG